MKENLIKKIVSLFSYEELIENIPKKNNLEIKFSKIKKKFWQYSSLIMLIAGCLNNIIFSYNWMFSENISSLSLSLSAAFSTLFFYCFNTSLIFLSLFITLSYIKFKKRLKKDNNWEKNSLAKNFNYTDKSGFISFLRLINDFHDESVLKNIGEEKLSLNMYKKLAQKLEKEDMLKIVNENFSYNDLNMDSIYLGENKKIKQYFKDEFEDHKKECLKNITMNTIAEEFVESLYLTIETNK